MNTSCTQRHENIQTGNDKRRREGGLLVLSFYKKVRLRKDWESFMYLLGEVSFLSELLYLLHEFGFVGTRHFINLFTVFEKHYRWHTLNSYFFSQLLFMRKTTIMERISVVTKNMNKILSVKGILRYRLHQVKIN